MISSNERDFEYVIADPAGNITVLILSSYENESERSQMISKAFELEQDCEQAGFISSVSAGHVRLEMMGYEFCGNASLSAACWQAFRDGIGLYEQAEILVDSSGIDETLRVDVRRNGDLCLCDSGLRYPYFTGRISMPVPEMSEFNGMPVMRLPGISHIIAEVSEMTEDMAESLIKEYVAELGGSALGIILCQGLERIRDESASGSVEAEIKPLVYVPESGTMVWEHGCATGSTAVGYYLYLKGYRETDVYQPGGLIRISMKKGRPVMTGSVILRTRL